MNFREKLQRSMQGRYGTDDLNKFLLILSLVLCFISFFINSGLISTVAFLLLLLCYMRMFSRKIYKRHGENQKYLELKNKVASSLHLNRIGQMKDYRFFKCPICKQTVRVPRGKGKIKIHCPKCQNDFIKKS